MAQFFYDKQIKRFLGQIVSVFSHFDVEFGDDDAGNPVYRRVPVTYATNEKMSASIIRNNSENTMNTVPAMSVYITGLEYDRDRIQNPTFVDKKNVREKRYNSDTGNYESRPGNLLTVERHMPVPYKLSFNVDIWTSNTEQKLQLLEQILVLFNPDFEIQNTDNYLDWTSLSYMHIDNINYSSRTIPMGTEESLDIATLSLYCPIWLSAPAKVKKLGVVEKIVSGIYSAGSQFNEGVIDSVDSLGKKVYTTPTGYNLIMLNGQATIYPIRNSNANSDITDVDDAVGNAVSWETFVSYFGELKNGITQLRLRKDNATSEIVGTVSLNPSDPFSLLFNVDEDTVPGNTLRPVDAIIDPTRSAPGINNLPTASAGQRYLILEPINSGERYSNSMDGADAWKNGSEDFFANQYDIIEYTGTEWQVSWSSTDHNNVEHVTNLKTGLQYQWTGENWINSWEGEYPEGSWSLVL